MATIKDLPSGDIGNAGEEFDWSVWQQDTTVTLTAVSWDNSYKDVVMFGRQNSKYKSLDSYLDSKTNNRTYRNLAYQDVNRPIRIPVGIGVAQFYNYVRVTSPRQPVDDDIPRTFYYFITDVRRVAPDTTEIIVQLDVWNTYRDNVSFGNCYLERGHVLMAEKERFADHGRRFLTVPEGLNIGSEYVGRYGHTEVLSNGNNYLVMVSTTISWEKDFGTKDNPKLNMATGTYSQNMFNGVNIYIMTVPTWQGISAALSQFPWISQGIISIQGVPHTLINLPKLKKISMVNIKFGAGVYVYTLDDSDKRGAINSSKDIKMISGWRNKLTRNIPARYSGFDKLKTYPYTQITITAFTGNPLILKPECWNDEDMTVTQFAQVSPPNNRVIWSPVNYNIQNKPTDNSVAGQAMLGDFWGQQTGIYNWPTYMMANDGARLAYASQAHSINWSYHNADWSQQKALQSASTAASQASNSIANMGAQNNVAVSARNQQTATANSARSQNQHYQNMANWGNATVNGLGSIARGGGAGVVGALVGVGGAAISNMAGNASLAVNNAAATQSTDIANAASTASTAISQSGASYVRDTNKQLADYVANGDYANAVAGINAKVQDLNVVPPSTVGQMGGETFNISTWVWAVVAQVRSITDGAMDVLCNYWARYGYAIDRYFYRLNDSMDVMSRFTYWKVSELYLTPKNWCPQNYLNTLRGIFEKGVTVWNSPDDVGQVSIFDNKVTREKVYF